MRIVKSAVVRRQELLDSALKLFASKGYDQTSVADVIDAVGISKGAFYHHFAAKEELLEALAADFAQRSARRAQSVLADPTLDAFDRLSRFLSRLRDSKLEAAADLHAALAPIFRPENSQLYDRTQAAVSAVVRPMLVDIITEGVAEQTFDTPDPARAAEVILHLMGSARHQIAALYAETSPKEVERRIAALYDTMRYLGTVVDRILGIPEGSIELVDPCSLDVMGAVWRRTAVA